MLLIARYCIHAFPFIHKPNLIRFVGEKYNKWYLLLWFLIPWFLCFDVHYFLFQLVSHIAATHFSFGWCWCIYSHYTMTTATITTSAPHSFLFHFLIISHSVMWEMTMHLITKYNCSAIGSPNQHVCNKSPIEIYWIWNSWSITLKLDQHLRAQWFIVLFMLEAFLRCIQTSMWHWKVAAYSEKKNIHSAV